MVTADPCRPIAPGERIVGHLPPRPLDPLSAQIHRHYRERQDDLKARYARIKTVESVPDPDKGTASSAQAGPASTQTTQAATATQTAEEEADEAWLASLVVAYRASALDEEGS